MHQLKVLVCGAVQHTSASLTINENCSPDVPLDLNDALDRIAPEGRHYRHLDEGMVGKLVLSRQCTLRSLSGVCSQVGTCAWRPKALIDCCTFRMICQPTSNLH